MRVEKDMVRQYCGWVMRIYLRIGSAVICDIIYSAKGGIFAMDGFMLLLLLLLLRAIPPAPPRRGPAESCSVAPRHVVTEG
jgi:hypothetical protein